MDFDDLSDVPIEEIYREMGNFIVRATDDEWSSAILYAEIEEDDNGLTYGRYNTETVSDYSLNFDTDYTVYFAFDELRTRLHKPGQAPWTKARFILQRTGKFDLEFDYPD